MIDSFTAWFKKGQRRKIIAPVIAILYMIYMSYRSLSIRIEATGWQHFPATLLDWCAIIGSVIFFFLFVFFVKGISQIYWKSENSES